MPSSGSTTPTGAVPATAAPAARALQSHYRWGRAAGVALSSLPKVALPFCRAKLGAAAGMAAAGPACRCAVMAACRSDP